MKLGSRQHLNPSGHSEETLGVRPAFVSGIERRRRWVQPARLIWPIFLLLSLSACGASMKSKPVYRENPHPTQAYRLTMRIADAPGPLRVMRSLAIYNVVNRECLPPPMENFGGHTSPVPSWRIPLALVRTAEGEYAGTFHLDGMIDEDYHGRGVCRWEMSQVLIHLKATGAEGETLFTANLEQRWDGFSADKPKTTYYIRNQYPRIPGSTSDTPVSNGQTVRSRIAPYLADEDLFTITLVAEEITR